MVENQWWPTRSYAAIASKPTAHPAEDFPHRNMQATLVSRLPCGAQLPDLGWSMA